VDKKLKYNDENTSSRNSASDKIAEKSSRLKAALKSKYLICKLERSFLNNYES
jgi:hypothetical protein